MKIVILTAVGVGFATVFGSFIGFALKKIPHKFNDIVLSFAAGIMLAAAVLGLIVPAVESSAGLGGLLISSYKQNKSIEALTQEFIKNNS